MTEYLKAERLTTTKWRVLSIPFGGPFDGKDFDTEFFSINTDIKPHWFDRRPGIWHHNQDDAMKADSEIGVSDDLERDDDIGWWSTLWLDRSHRYWAEVDRMLQKGKLYGSSGTLPNFVRTDRKTGEIRVWPFVEQTLTPTPSNFLSQVAAAKALPSYYDLSDAPDDLRPDLPSGGDADAARLRALGLADATLATYRTR